MINKHLVVGIKWLLLLLFLTIATAVVLFKASKNISWQPFGKLVLRIETQEKLIALTFDDGPEPGATEQLLELLKAQKVKASFFLVGNAIQKHPQQARLIADAGHQLGNHSYTHSRMIFVGYQQVAEELQKTDALIRQAGYQGEILFRPPYGKKLFNLPRYLADQNTTSVTWDIAPETFGPEQQSAAEISDFIIDNARAGSIILLHPMYQNRGTINQALPTVITKLRQHGYRFVTLSELLAANTP